MVFFLGMTSACILREAEVMLEKLLSINFNMV